MVIDHFLVIVIYAMFLSPITRLQRHVELVQTIDALCFIICFA
jgi:hypothetical protein